jgi:hypothetical protein
MSVLRKTDPLQHVKRGNKWEQVIQARTWWWHQYHCNFSICISSGPLLIIASVEFQMGPCICKEILLLFNLLSHHSHQSLDLFTESRTLYINGLLAQNSLPSIQHSTNQGTRQSAVNSRLQLTVVYYVECHRNTSTIWLYTSSRIFTSQAVRLENRMWCPRRFSTPVM